MRYWNFLIVIILISYGHSEAQDNFSESFINFSRSMQLYSPSIACTENNFESNLDYRTYFGKLSVIRTYYADINYNQGRKESSHLRSYKHVVGLGFYNDREGDFFTRSRILLRYAVHIPISEDLYFSGGASIHLINYNFNASGSGASGSDWTGSGSIGASLYSSGFKLAVSFNDFNSPEVRPINYEFKIPHYFTFFGEKLADITSNVQLKGNGRCNLLYYNQISYILQLGLIFSNTVGLSGFYYGNKGTGLIVDLNRVKLHQGLIDFSFAYMVPGKNITPGVSQYELNLRFALDR